MKRLFLMARSKCGVLQRFVAGSMRIGRHDMQAAHDAVPPKREGCEFNSHPWRP